MFGIHMLGGNTVNRLKLPDDRQTIGVARGGALGARAPPLSYKLTFLIPKSQDAIACA